MPRSLTNVGGTLYFRATDGSTGYELWKSDGTSTGTALVRDIRTGASSSSPQFLTNLGGTLYFRANDGSTGYELWKSDGTSTGTTLVKDIRPGGVNGSYPLSLTNMGGTLYFGANDGSTGFELWKSDGTSSGTTLVKDIFSGASNSFPERLANAGGTLYFRANDGATGYELWKSDGTSSGTVLVDDIRLGSPASYPSALTVIGPNLFFQADDGLVGAEPWVLDINDPPTIAIGGPYTVTEGSSGGLSASATDPNPGIGLTYTWDLDGDNAFGDAIGPTPGITWTQLQLLGFVDGPAPHSISLRVTDGYGASSTSSTTLSVTNTAPSIFSNGLLDVTFAGDGKRTTALGPGDDSANSVVVQSDGKIVVAGRSSNGSLGDFALLRYNTDGSLDTSFDGDGMLTTSVGAGVDVARGLAIQPDGKLVVVGYSHNGSNNDFAVVRYNTNGSLDTSFDGDGMLTTALGPGSDQGWAVAIQPDGKLVVAGPSSNGFNFDFAIVRYNANGSLDTTFDGDGRVTTAVGSISDYAKSVVVQPDGKLVVAGLSNNGSIDTFAVVRYNADGSLDTSFDGDGKLTTIVDTSDSLGQSVALQADGRIVVAGGTYVSGTYDFALVRYNTDGSLDTSFDGDGKLTTPLGAGEDFGYGVVIQADGRIVVAGNVLSGGTYDFGVARYHANGALDTSFNGVGKLILAIGSGDDEAQALALAPDGRLVVAGSSFVGANREVAVVRLGGQLASSPTSVSEGATVSVAATSAASDPSTADTTAGFHYAFDYTNDGTFDLGSGTYAGSGASSSAAVPAIDGGASPTTQTVRVRVLDKDGGFHDYLTPFTVNNVAPTASAGGPYTIAQGSSLALAGSGSDPGTLDTPTYAWDLNNDGVFTDATGASPVLTWAQLVTLGINTGPATYPNMRLRVTDKDSAVTTSPATTLTVTNSAPVANAGGPYTVAEGASLAMHAGATTDADLPYGDVLAYTWDVNGDGTFGDAVGASPTLTWAQLVTLGINNGPATYGNVQVRVTDLAGNVSVTAGTRLVRDISPGGGLSSPSNLTNVGGTLFFRANDGTIGYELWKSDGTSSGTILVKDILAGAIGSSPSNLTNVGGMLYFSANGGSTGYELWKSDGTSSGTTLVKDIHLGANLSSTPGSLTNVGGTLYFRANDGSTGYELWKSDGTSSGTNLVKDIRAGALASSPQFLTNVGGTLYFPANDGTNGFELWKSDGTSSGTAIIANIRPGLSSFSPINLANVGGTLYFVANDGTNGGELWKSDGTSSGTILVNDIRTGPGSSFPAFLTNVAGTLYFQAIDATNGSELWKSDGTSSGTMLVRDIRSGVNSSNPSDLTIVGGTLYFKANDGTNGFELWKSDGTSSGTSLVKNIRSGVNTSANPTSLTNVGGALYFSANNGSLGYELWKSNGTVSGTLLSKDIFSGSGSSDPGSLTNVRGTLYFNANDGSTGQELWASDPEPATLTVTNTAPTAGSFVNTGPVAIGSSVTVSFGGQADPSPIDTAAGFTYRYDFNNDGDFTDLGDVNGSPTASAGFTFLTAGTKTVRGRIEDQDGGFTEYFTTLDVIAAPHVINVAVKGSAWAIPAYSIPVGSAAQTAPLPWNNLDTIAITFDADVNIQQSDLAIRGVNVASYSTSGFSYVSATKTATWTLPTSIGIDKLILDLAGSGGDPVREALFNQTLDGEWANNSDTYPSGNNTAGGDFEFRCSVLPGDVNQSGSVLGNDVILTRNAQFTSYGGGGYSVFRDVNGSGTINGGDVVSVQNRQFTVLPAGSPSSPSPPQPPDSLGGIVAPPTTTRVSTLPSPTAGTKFDVIWKLSQTALAHQQVFGAGRDFWSKTLDNELTTILASSLSQRKTA